MAFRACVLAHSISPDRDELVSFGIEYPREILPEVNTHTIVGKSTSSSRAIPVEKMIDKVVNDPYTPAFGRNQRGMQAGSELEQEESQSAFRCWERSRKLAVDHAREMAGYGAHKQVANRIIDNYGWTRQILTATQWANFFALRTHRDAHPAFQKIAQLMFVAYLRSKPKRLSYGEWHLPLIGEEDVPEAERITAGGYFPEEASELKSIFVERFGWDRGVRDLMLCCMSAARCARVSYNKIDGPGKTTVMEDWVTMRRLVIRRQEEDSPIHPSPLLHQATPFHKASAANGPHLHSNLNGYIQFRKLVPRECIHEFRPSQHVVDAWQVDESCIITDPRDF